MGGEWRRGRLYRVVPTCRSDIPEGLATFQLRMVPERRTSNSSPDLAYPGDDVVDTVGLDVYDAPTDARPVARWKRDVLEGPFGLRSLEGFAALRGKKMNIGEWEVGLKDAPDDPYFVEEMGRWLRRHAVSVAFHVYFDVPPHDLEGGKFPRARARFLKLFSGPRQ